MKTWRGFLLAVAAALVFPVFCMSREKPVKRDILYCVSLSKSFGKVGIGTYSEFTVDTSPVALGYNYSNLSVSYDALPWMRVSLAGGYTSEAGIRKWLHSIQFVQTLNKGAFTFWFRELVTHYRNPDTGVHSGIARFRANARYHIEGTAFSPLIASETYFWDEWRRTSFFVGTRADISPCISVNTYYMASFLQQRNMHHLVLSFGYRF